LLVSALVPEILKFEKPIKCANERTDNGTDDVLHSNGYYFKYINKALSQFAAETIET